MVLRVQDIKKTFKVNFKMKKTYISPNMLVVRLAMTQPLAASPFVLNNDAGNALDSEDILSKEVSTNVNVWDDEW